MTAIGTAAQQMRRREPAPHGESNTWRLVRQVSFVYSASSAHRGTAISRNSLVQQRSVPLSTNGSGNLRLASQMDPRR
jgi:hypothetical protein